MVVIAGVVSVFAIHITVTASMPHYHDSTTSNQGKLSIFLIKTHFLKTLITQ